MIPSSASSSQLGHTPDQDSIRSSLKSCLECLDRHNDKIIRVYREIIDIRTRITALLREIVVDEPQAIVAVVLDRFNAMLPLLSTPLDLLPLPQPPALHGRLSDEECGPSESAGGIGLLPEATYPPAHYNCSPDLLLCGTSGFVSQELGAQPFLPHHGTYSEGQTLSGPSSRRDQLFPLPIAQGSQDQVKCTWPGCLRFVKKDSRTRHVNETHLRKVKAVCASCGKGFARLYMKKDHICPAAM
ncbi:hypothetical protein DEU56DRAFT_822267 [Suillus clintonianus]|uniref:uncharacterized protein n=1 Tax=Suillus clintonianus TaxID=1904413 RepID=UPI001B88505A|nr:uncharacterized protein DEU56DRAFT_822267 [Suillus clintonianus]KAG2126518.1 hypothetical protein DEU56DRAFT_822267 [Suillus clintonianus]